MFVGYTYVDGWDSLPHSWRRLFKDALLLKASILNKVPPVQNRFRIFARNKSDEAVLYVPESC